VLSVLALLPVTAAAGCSSSTSGSTTTSLPATSAPTTTESPSAVRHQVEHVYATLFNFGDKSVSAKTAAVQDGAGLARAFRQALSSSLAKEATGARVRSVDVLTVALCGQAAVPAPCAKVTYDILGAGGKPLFPTSSVGYSVETNGRWLVAKSTICSLLTLFYSASGKKGSPPGC
jgi:hypothetical protein